MKLNQEKGVDLNSHVSALLQQNHRLDQFDLTNLESVAEQVVTSKALHVRRIMPMI